MKKSSLILLVWVICISISGCEKNNCYINKTETVLNSWNTQSFDTLYIQGKMNVEIHQDTFFNIKMVGTHIQPNNIQISQESGILKIIYLPTCDWKRNYSDSLHVIVSVPSLRFIDCRINGILKTLKPFETERLKISCFDAGGSIFFNFKGAEFAIALNTGLFDANIEGNTQVLYLYSGSSTGVIQAHQLQSNKAYCTNQNTGDFWVNCTDTLFAEINHSGNIYYSGNPKVIRIGDGIGKLVRY